MKYYMLIAGTLILGIFLVSCSNDQSDSTVETPQDKPVIENSATGDSESISSSPEQEKNFVPEYIYAEDLKAALDGSGAPFVFDVRSQPSYQKNHVITALSMPYGKTDDARLATVEGISKQSQIVTYCGCPRHLSTLSAEALGKMGYENVRVLYEGYWHWKDNGFPIVDNETTSDLATLHFEGRLTRHGHSAKENDVFLRHQPTGQLEAVRTAIDGTFSVDFHLYDYHAGDQFDVILDRVDNQPVRHIATASGKNNLLLMNL